MGKFDAAIDWLEAFMEKCAGPEHCPQCAEHAAAIRVLEAAGKVSERDLGRVFTGFVSVELRELLEAIRDAALPDEVKP